MHIVQFYWIYYYYLWTFLGSVCIYLSKFLKNVIKILWCRPMDQVGLGAGRAQTRAGQPIYAGPRLRWQNRKSKSPLQSSIQLRLQLKRVPPLFRLRSLSLSLKCPKRYDATDRTARIEPRHGEERRAGLAQQLPLVLRPRRRSILQIRHKVLARTVAADPRAFSSSSSSAAGDSRRSGIGCRWIGGSEAR